MPARTPPLRTTWSASKAEVKKLYDATEVMLNVTVDESLLSGYVLQIGDRVFDNSGRHAIDQMMADKRPVWPPSRPVSRTTSPPPPAQRAAWSSPPPTASWKVDGMDRAGLRRDRHL